MEVIHDALSESDLSHSMTELGYVDPGMAFQEYENNGQGGLDALLTALDGSSEVMSEQTSRGGALCACPRMHHRNPWSYCCQHLLLRWKLQGRWK